MTVPTVAMMPKKKKKKGAARAAAVTASDAPVQRGLVSAKVGMERGGRPEAEAKDRVERIMSALAENWWNRRRKLLPIFRLTYPSDNESRQIAELASVSDAWRFARTIESTILDAHLSDANFRTLSIPQVKRALKRVVSEANGFRHILSKLDVGRGSKGSEYEAGWLIERELASHEFVILVPAYIDLLDALSAAAQRAKQKPMRVPKGAGGNPAFDRFIEDLLMAARMLGGDWTNYRSRDEIWKGTLLEALGILKKYLPKGFFPPGELGRSVEHIRKKLKDHIKKAPARRLMPQ
jgi:hypothetical protein